MGVMNVAFSGYKIIKIDLGDGKGDGTGQQIGDPQMPITQWSIIDIDTTALVTFTIGAGNDQIPGKFGLEMDLGECDATKSGLYAQYAPQAGLTVTVAVTYGGGRIGVRAG